MAPDRNVEAVLDFGRYRHRCAMASSFCAVLGPLADRSNHSRNLSLDSVG